MPQQDADRMPGLKTGAIRNASGCLPSQTKKCASLSFFSQCGVAPWRELVKTRGIVGTPLLEVNTRFLKSVTYGETLAIATHVAEWRDKVFVQVHRVKRGDVLVCEGREVRAFVERAPDDPERLRAIPVPEDIRALCS